LAAEKDKLSVLCHKFIVARGRFVLKPNAQKYEPTMLSLRESTEKLTAV
jgi:hypothetical protein